MRVHIREAQARQRAALSIAGIAAGIALFVCQAPAWAHHAFAAEFDSNKPLRFDDATVTKVQLINPHSWINVDVKFPDGRVENWAIEAGSPNILLRRGITRDTLKVGTKLFLGGSGGEGAPYEVQRPGVDIQKK
jgi:hypothetical protein